MDTNNDVSNVLFDYGKLFDKEWSWQHKGG